MWKCLDKKCFAPNETRIFLRRRSGFTILELLIVLVVIGLLTSLLLPAVQMAREAARRSQCASNLRQIGVAIQNHVSHTGRFPTLFVQIDILPYIDQPVLAQLCAADNEEEAAKTLIPLYLCPSESSPTRGLTGRGMNSYCSNYSSGYQKYRSNGFFDRDRRATLTPADITDGLSQTIAMSEKLYSVSDDDSDRMRNLWSPPYPFDQPNELDSFADFCEGIPLNPTNWGYRRSEHWGMAWVFEASYNHLLPPNRPSCTNNNVYNYNCLTATSLHPNGVNALFGDGHVSFVSQSIDRTAWRQLGSRSEGLNASP